MSDNIDHYSPSNLPYHREEQLYSDAINKFGKAVQIDIAIEEASELIHALSKLKRNTNLEDDGKNFFRYLDYLVSEMVDVEMMKLQLFKMFEKYNLEDRFNTRLLAVHGKLRSIINGGDDV